MLGESSETTQAARLVVVIGHGLCGGLLRSAHLGVGSLAALAAIAACNGEPRNTGTPRGYDGDVEVSKMDSFYFSKIHENPTKMDDLGVYTTILGNLQKWSGSLESTGKIYNQHQPTIWGCRVYPICHITIYNISECYPCTNKPETPWFLTISNQNCALTTACEAAIIHHSAYQMISRMDGPGLYINLDHILYIYVHIYICIYTYSLIPIFPDWISKHLKRSILLYTWFVYSK